MKSITKNRLGLTAGLTGALLAAGSIQAAPFEPGIDFTADVVSNYVFRGADVHQQKFEQDGKSYSSFNNAPALQPSLTFKFAEGWSLNIWGSFAMKGRADVDTDQLLQKGAGNTDLQTAYLTGLQNNNLDIVTMARNAATGNEASLLSDSSKVPGYYKEANGLRRKDEVDLTLSYSVGTKLGTMTGGIVSYNYTNISQQTATDIEMFAGFAPAALPELSLTAYFNVATPGKSGSTYTYLAYTKAIEINDKMNVAIAPGIGYATDTSAKIQGFQNANLPITLNMGGFHVGVTGVYRPETAFLDTDVSRGDAVELLGGSGKFDGMIANPAGTTGIINTIANGKATADIQTTLASGGAPAFMLGTTGYTYTPRQSFPKIVYFYTVGYTASF